MQPGRNQAEIISTSDSQSNSFGQLLRQKRWHQDIKNSKMQQSQDSNLTEDRKSKIKEQELTGFDLVSDKTHDYLPEFIKSGTDIYSPHSETKSSPRSGTGWQGHKTYSSTDGRSDDAPVRSIEFEDDEPSDGDPIKSPSSIYAHPGATITIPRVSSSHSGIAPADYQEEYEHMLPISLERIAQPDLEFHDRLPAIHTSLQSDIDKLTSIERFHAGHSSTPTIYPSKITSSSYDQGLDRDDSSPSIHQSGLLTEKRPRAESRRDSQQGRRQTSRFGIEDFGLLTEDPFEITAPESGIR